MNLSKFLISKLIYKMKLQDPSPVTIIKRSALALAHSKRSITMSGSYHIIVGRTSGGEGSWTKQVWTLLAAAPPHAHLSGFPSLRFQPPPS